MRPTPCFAFAGLLLVACGPSTVVKGGPFPGDPANLTYELDGKDVKLTKGTHEVKTGTGVDDFIATDLTQSRLDADLDSDGSTDAAVVLTQDSGKLKVHYLSVILNKGATDLDPVTIALGKNVLVQNLSLHKKGGVVVELLMQDEGAADDTPPTIRKERRFVIEGGQLLER